MQVNNAGEIGIIMHVAALRAFKHGAGFVSIYS